MWHQLSLAEIEKKLQTNISEGLTWEQANDRLRVHGKNTIPEGKTDSLLFFFTPIQKSAYFRTCCRKRCRFLGEFIDAGVILCSCV